MTWCEADRLDYVFGLVRNRRLVERIHIDLIWADDEGGQTGRSAQRVADFRWASRGSCSRKRCVVAKAEWMPIRR